MHQEYMNEIAKQLEQFKGLLSFMESGALRSENQEVAVASVKRNIALNEAVLRIEKDRALKAARSN
jgi:hypothetical protein